MNAFNLAAFLAAAMDASSTPMDGESNACATREDPNACGTPEPASESPDKGDGPNGCPTPLGELECPSLRRRATNAMKHPKRASSAKGRGKGAKRRTARAS